jgi:hypothetical protein
MPGIFSRRKKDGKSKKNGLDDASDLVLQKKKWDDAWTRKTVEPEEVRELLCGCTEELKNRGRIPAITQASPNSFRRLGGLAAHNCGLTLPL